jgi:hypothetical protein
MRSQRRWGMATRAWWWGGGKRLGRLRLRKYRILPSLQKDYVFAKCQ